MLNAKYSLNILLQSGFIVYHQKFLKTFYKIKLVLEHIHLDFLMFFNVFTHVSLKRKVMKSPKSLYVSKRNSSNLQT